MILAWEIIRVLNWLRSLAMIVETVVKCEDLLQICLKYLIYAAKTAWTISFKGGFMGRFQIKYLQTPSTQTPEESTGVQRPVLPSFLPDFRCSACRWTRPSWGSAPWPWRACSGRCRRWWRGPGTGPLPWSSSAASPSASRGCTPTPGTGGRRRTSRGGTSYWTPPVLHDKWKKTTGQFQHSLTTSAQATAAAGLINSCRGLVPIHLHQHHYHRGYTVVKAPQTDRQTPAVVYTQENTQKHRQLLSCDPQKEVMLDKQLIHVGAKLKMNNSYRHRLPPTRSS